MTAKIFHERIAIDLLDSAGKAANESSTATATPETIADVRLIRAAKMNALDPPMFAALVDAGAWLMKQSQLRAIVLSGEGRSFCAGLDMANFTNSGLGDNVVSAESKAPLSERTYGNANLYQHVAMVWRRLPIPVVAAMHGVCFGGGLQIASGADIRIAAPDARLAIMEMRWGLVPDMGGFALWRGLVHDDILRELTYSNREFSGEEAQQLGFVTYVDNEPHARALNIAVTIANRNPQAIRHVKEICNRLADMDEDAILLAESAAQEDVARSPNQIEAVLAQIEKRPPRFKAS